MKMAYIHYAEPTGKVLPEGWDTVDLAKAVSPKGARGMRIPAEEDDPDYHPEPINLIPLVLVSKIEEYMDKFDRELGELKEIQEKGKARDYTRAKRNRREELENKFSEFEIDRDIWLASRGGSRREVEPESQEEPENPRDQSGLESPWDQPKLKKGTYPALGSPTRGRRKRIWILPLRRTTTSYNPGERRSDKM